MIKTIKNKSQYHYNSAYYDEGITWLQGKTENVARQEQAPLGLSQGYLLGVSIKSRYTEFSPHHQRGKPLVWT